ncbi:HIT domain-containing protein [Kibdelosporangium philippinense]|uniref:HIT domain-containing protein n=1 Tax=Kibdelosporangium philippinense TaxID=211113 RepID=A0ABS8ZLB2_9PSEU|nr:HIT domain-containing protein [Kibdelosporangium philippinense]MCE7008588.1 HIT domain-containing protein [Kibdelosporangium philippinense]
MTQTHAIDDAVRRYRPDCIFCRMDDPSVNRILEQSDNFYVRYDNFPATDGHVEIVPKRHVVSFFELAPGEVAEAYQLMSDVRSTLTAIHDPQGFTIGINDGRAAGRTIDHLHIHLVPRYDGDVTDPRGGIRRALPNGDPALWTDSSLTEFDRRGHVPIRPPT